MHLAQKADRTANRRPRSAEPLKRGLQTHEAPVAVAPSAGAKKKQPEKNSRVGKHGIDMPDNAESSAAGLDSAGAGPQGPPMIGRLKTPVLRGIEVGGGGAFEIR